VDVSQLTGEANLPGKQVPKSLFLDVVAVLNAKGINSEDIPAKLEGLAFGQDVVIGGVVEHTLFVTNDNDFVPTLTDSFHLAGVANPNRFFVFAFDDDDLPGFEPQHFRAHWDHDKDR